MLQVEHLAGNVPRGQLKTVEAKVAREIARARWAVMTPQEHHAATQASRSKKEAEWTALDWIASESTEPRNLSGTLPRPLIKKEPTHPDIDMQPLRSLNSIQVQVAQ